MVETAAGGELEGVRLEKGGDIAKLHSAADKGTSCVVRAKVAELLTKATLERPKDTKDRADQRLARAQAAKGAQGRTGGEPIRVFVSGHFMYFTTTHRLGLHGQRACRC